MKICHISTGFPLSFQGGITNYVRIVAEDQYRKGNEVSVICGMDDENFSYEIFQYKSKIIPRRIQKLEDKKSLKIIEDYLKRKKFDIIHIHMALDIDWDLYSILEPYHYIISLHDYFFLCPRIKMVSYDNTVCFKYNRDKCKHCVSWFNTHRILNGIEYRIGKYCGIQSFRLPNIPQKMTTTRFNKFKKLLERADYLLPVSKRVQEIYQQSGIYGNYKVMHIGNISADQFKEEFQFDHSNRKIRIAMMGAVSYLKGADEFIKFRNLLPVEKFDLVFYGRSNEYKVKFQECGIIDNGPYNQTDLNNILQNVDLGCVLSVWEDNGPQVVMEFLNNHVPVIGTKMGGIPDFVNDNNGYLYNPYDEKELISVVEKIKSLTIEDVYYLKKCISRTKTTSDHGNELMALYKSII